MGKRPLDSPAANTRGKRPCNRPLASQKLESADDKRKSIGQPIKKATVPAPFKLSGRSAWREAQTHKLKEQEEARRRQLETFKPQINASAKRYTLRITNANTVNNGCKRQVSESSTVTESKENTGHSNVLVPPHPIISRTPLVPLTNAFHPPATKCQHKGTKAPGMLDRSSVHTKPGLTPNGALTARNLSNTKAATETGPIKSRISMGPPKLLVLEGRPATGRQSMFCRPQKQENESHHLQPASNPQRRASVAVCSQNSGRDPHLMGGQPAASTVHGANPLVGPAARARIQGSSLARPLAEAPDASSCTSLSRRATAGPAQHGVPANLAAQRRTVTFEEPPVSSLLPMSNPFEGLGPRPLGHFKDFMNGCFKESALPTAPSPGLVVNGTPERSSSAPTPGDRTCSTSLSNDILISDDDAEGNMKNYGPDGYCYIRKGNTLCDGRYTALHKLGEGKYSTVWLMYDKEGPYTEHSNFVAVKVGRAMPSDVLPEDIKRESNLLDHINNTHSSSELRYLATVIGSFVHKGSYGVHACMVFKVLGSQLLRLVYERHEAFRSGIPLDISAVINVFRCILQGTAGFHKYNIVHTDLKPENILLAVPDEEVVELMKTFTRENNLPAPYLEHRQQVSLTPHRRATTPLPTSSPGTRRSDSVDPLDFWTNRSPAALHDADEQAKGQLTGRSTMACIQQECSLPSEPTMWGTDFEMSQGMSSEGHTTTSIQQPSSPASGKAECLAQSPLPSTVPRFICTKRGAIGPAAGSPNLCVDDGVDSSSDTGIAEGQDTPQKGTLQCTSEAMEVDQENQQLLLQTPSHEERCINPGTPQYVIEQGKGTEVLIGDFGLAMVLQHSHELSPPGVQIYPQDCVVMNHNHGMVIQTREYRAPEILLGQDFNVKIDIYSIACIMVEVITGEYLWDPKNTVPRRSCTVEQEIDREHLQHMIAVMGIDEFDKLRARRTFFKSRFFLPNGEPKIAMARKRKPKSRPLASILAPHIPEPLLSEVTYLLAKMLEFHPNDRWSATQCLEFLERPAFKDYYAADAK